MAYDALCRCCGSRGVSEYLAVLQLAAQRSEVAVDGALGGCMAEGRELSSGMIEAMIEEGSPRPRGVAVSIGPVDLGAYDALLEGVVL